MFKSLKNIKVDVVASKEISEQVQEIKERIGKKAEKAIKMAATEVNERKELNEILDKLLSLSKTIDILPERIEDANVLLEEYKILEQKIDEVVKQHQIDNEITL